MKTTKQNRKQETLSLLRSSWQACIGLSLLNAWLYLLFFSNAAYTGPALNIPEKYWAYVAIAESATALALLLASRRRALTLAKPIVLTGALLMTAGSICSCVACSTLGPNTPAAPVALLFVGAGSTFLHLAWLRKILLLSKDAGQFAVACSLLLSFLLYLAITPLPGIVSVPIASLLPPVSAVFSFAVKGKKPVKNGAAHVAGFRSSDKGHRMKLAAIVALLLLLWLNFAFFRIIASPWDTETLETAHSFLFIVLTILMACVLFLYFHNDWADIPQVPRAIVCVLCLSYLFLYFDFENPVNGMASFAICFSCIVIVQLFVWFVGLALLRETDLKPTWLFLPYCAIKGIGIFFGVELGTYSCIACGGSIPSTFPFLLLTLLFALTMIVDMSWIKRALGRQATSSLGSNTTSDALSPQERDILIGDFAAQYMITAREQDVLKLLIAGRNRPFIQEELCISRGTVNSHVSSIYGKTSTHSQQDIISLYEEYAKARL